MASTEDVAEDLGVDVGDVRVLLRQLGEQTPDAPDELAAFIRQAFQPARGTHRAAGLYCPGADDEPRRVFGLGGPDPTAR